MEEFLLDIGFRVTNKFDFTYFGYNIIRQVYCLDSLFVFVDYKKGSEWQYRIGSRENCCILPSRDFCNKVEAMVYLVNLLENRKIET